MQCVCVCVCEGGGQAGRRAVVPWMSHDSHPQRIHTHTDLNSHRKCPEEEIFFFFSTISCFNFNPSFNNRKNKSSHNLKRLSRTTFLSAISLSRSLSISARTGPPRKHQTCPSPNKRGNVFQVTWTEEEPAGGWWRSLRNRTGPSWSAVSSCGQKGSTRSPTQCLCSEENFKNQESASQGFKHAAKANQFEKKNDNNQRACEGSGSHTPRTTQWRVWTSWSHLEPLEPPGMPQVSVSALLEKHPPASTKCVCVVFFFSHWSL